MFTFQGWSNVQHLERPEPTDKIEQGWGFPWHRKGCSTHSSSFTIISKMMINNPFLMITIATTSFTNRCAVLHFPSWSPPEFHDFTILWFHDDQYSLVDHHHYHHHHYDHHHHHYQVHQWMCTVRIGKFIQEYAAVYLTAGLENILVCIHVNQKNISACNHVDQRISWSVFMLTKQLSTPSSWSYRRRHWTFA